MPKLLVETRMNNLSLCESVNGSKPHKGCLGTLKGPCADLVKPTRNKNLYTRKLWENVFNDEIVKESLEDRVLIGELDHPGDRLETKAANAAIVMTDYSFNDKDNLLMGSFDILDTPMGRILKSLIDYGCRVGVSSRGEGDVEEVPYEGETVNKVDEDGYDFVAFDAVILPAVKAAKPSLSESLGRRKTLTESILHEVDSATSVCELDLIKKVVESADLPESDSILESVNNKSQELSTGSTGSSSVLKDLEESIEEVQRLSDELSSVRLDLTTCQSKYNNQIKSRQRLVRESSKLKQELKNLRSEYNSLVFESSSSHCEIESLRSQLSESQSRSQSLQSQLRSTSSKVRAYESEIESLKETMHALQESHKKQKTAIDSLKSRLEFVQKESSSKLKESVQRDTRLRSSIKVATESLKEYRESYIVETCKCRGIDAAKVLERVDPSMTKSKIDSIIKEETDRVARYKSLPITQDNLIGILEGATVSYNGPTSESGQELARTYQFMEETSKLF